MIVDMLTCEAGAVPRPDAYAAMRQHVGCRMFYLYASAMSLVVGAFLFVHTREYVFLPKVEYCNH